MSARSSADAQQDSRGEQAGAVNLPLVLRLTGRVSAQRLVLVRLMQLRRFCALHEEQVRAQMHPRYRTLNGCLPACFDSQNLQIKSAKVRTGRLLSGLSRISLQKSVQEQRAAR